MKTLKLLIKRVSLIKSMMFCASTFSNKFLIEESTKCLRKLNAADIARVVKAKVPRYAMLILQ